MIDLGCFGENYDTSRSIFLERVEACHGEVATYRHPAARGPQGQDLFVDVGVVGPPRASRALVVLSGVHGTEAVISAGLANDLLRSRLVSELPPDMSLVLIHALNPWGMAHKTRTTENNVDLNRNFVDFSQPLPQNPGYAALHSIVSRDDIASAIRDLRACLAHPTEGARLDDRIDALMRGQYEFADGINFGGTREEWSNATLRTLLAQHVSCAKRVALIDWHTGIGKETEAVPLAFYDPASRSARALSEWFGRDVTHLGTHFPGGVAPRFTGILSMAIPTLLPSAVTYAVVVEFGTKPNADVLEALMVDRWLKFGPARDTALARRLEMKMLDCFSPTDSSWRAAVVESARELISRTIAGLARESN